MSLPYQYGQPMYNHGGSGPGSVPRTPLTPHTPISQTSAPSEPTALAQPTHTSAPPRTLQPPPTFPTAQPSSVRSMQNPLAYSAATGAPVDMLPRLQQQLQSHPSMPGGASAYASSTDPSPTHVVGQQGRRGILPSAPGRAAPNGKTPIPPKNDEGKFPCPHCTKTYLHAKHLKRHMLRHTGDRPYQCKLCKDTFSRSDILKRHFSKCSIRRGYTGDQNHLEGSRNHLKQNQQSRLSTGPLDQASYLTGATSGVGYDSSMVPHSYLQPVQQFLGNDAQVSEALSNRSSRSNSLMRPDYAVQASMSGFQPNSLAYSVPPAQPNPYAYHTAVTSAELQQYQPQPATAGANALTQNLAWSNGYGGLASSDAYAAFPQGMASVQAVKREHAGVDGGNTAQEEANNAAQAGFQAGGGNRQQNGFQAQQMYGPTSSHNSSVQAFDGWNLGDPFDIKAASLVAFCFADGLARTQDELHAMARLKEILTATNIKRYLHLYRVHWHEHWPLIHMPTFSTLDANDGLLLAMMCIGAIYANDLGLEMERWLMVWAKQSFERSFTTRNSGPQASPSANGRSALGIAEIEELQAFILIQAIHIWHGDRQHREDTRRDFRRWRTIVARYGLTEPLTYGEPGFSILHQSPQRQSQVDLDKWDWKTWVGQEQRSRVMHQVYLLDCALAIFFNHPPEFQASELHIPLPADDASYEARNAQECRDALGLNGAERQEAVNLSGSRRLSQPPIHLGMELLLFPHSEFAPRTTNVYSKFILIHALHATIWTLNNQALLANFQVQQNPNLTSYDWVSTSRPMSNLSGGRTSPVNGSQSQEMHLVKYALEKWKRAWEADIDLQYPPTTSCSETRCARRMGFCRDAVHYYWLAKQFLSTPQSLHWQAYESPDLRMSLVMGMLKQIKKYVAQEYHRLGKELGSVVGMGERYAVDMDSMNMRELFVALPRP